jgi:hypothetical protein
LEKMSLTAFAQGSASRLISTADRYDQPCYCYCYDPEQDAPLQRVS